MENSDSIDGMTRAVLALAGLALLFGLFSFFAAPPPAAASGSAYAAALASASLAAPASVPPECGDINDNANLQHLGHHPDRFQACYRVVDPAKFKAAVGQDVSTFIR